MRRLSNMEWATFLHEIDVADLNLPPWGGIVEWGGMDVLVYVGPSEVFLTDVTGEDELIARYDRVYDPLQESWVYRLPEAITQVLWERAEDVNAIVKSSVGVLSQPATWSLALMVAVVAFVILKTKG